MTETEKALGRLRRQLLLPHDASTAEIAEAVVNLRAHASALYERLDVYEPVDPWAPPRRPDDWTPQPDALVPFDVASECVDALVAVGFGQPGNTNTLWGMVGEAVAELVALRAWKAGVVAAATIARPPGEGAHTEKAWADHRGAYMACGPGGPYAEGADLVSEVDLRRRVAETDAAELRDYAERAHGLLVEAGCECDSHGEGGCVACHGERVLESPQACCHLTSDLNVENDGDDQVLVCSACMGVVSPSDPRKPCPTCKGTQGHEDGLMFVDCGACNGTGVFDPLRCQRCGGAGWDAETHAECDGEGCGSCEGGGRQIQCPDCDGDGRVCSSCGGTRYKPCTREPCTMAGIGRLLGETMVHGHPTDGPCPDCCGGAR